MSKKYSEELTKEQIKELEDIMGELTDTAKEVVEDYAKNPSEISGSTIHIHEDSPFVDDTLKGNEWKKVVRGSVLTDLTQKKEDKK